MRAVLLACALLLLAPAAAAAAPVVRVPGASGPGPKRS